MLSLAGRYDTAVLVSGDEDFVYAVNAVAYKGCRVEVAGFRSNTAPKLIDVADYFIDLGEIADKVRKEAQHTHRYYDHHPQEAQTPAFLHNNNHGNHAPQSPRAAGAEPHRDAELAPEDEEEDRPARHAALAESHETFEETVAHIMADNGLGEETDQFASQADFIRITDDQ